MEAPKLAWFGNEPVVVGDEIPEHPDGHVRIWRFVSGSEASAAPDEIEGGGGSLASRVKESLPGSSSSSSGGGSVTDLSGVATRQGDGEPAAPAEKQPP